MVFLTSDGCETEIQISHYGVRDADEGVNLEIQQDSRAFGDEGRCGCGCGENKNPELSTASCCSTGSAP